MQDPRRILIIDGDPSFRKNATRFLQERQCEVFTTSNATEGLEALKTRRPDFVLVDIGLSEPGFDIVDTVIASPEQPKVIGISQKARVSDVVAAVKAGALDVLERPVDGERLIRMMDRADNRAARPAASAAPSAARPVRMTREPQIDTLVADSDAMRAVIGRVERLAAQEATVVLEGELACGQESIARHYHATGPRAGGPFVMVRRGEGAEEELFGSADTVSAFARAKGGVVFVESIVSLKPSGQGRLAKLLSGLSAARQNGGGVRWPPMIVGIGRPIDVEVSSGAVRADLAQLLGRAAVVVPPLRSRREDIPELVYRVASAIQHAVGAPSYDVDPMVMQELVARDWDDNIEELVSIVSRSAVYDASGGIAFDLAASVAPPPPPPQITSQPVLRAVAPTPPPAPEPVAPPSDNWMPTLDDEGMIRPYDDYEAEIFRFALKNTGGCVSRAAEALGVGRATMYRKMRAYDIEVPPVSERAISRGRKARRARSVAARKSETRQTS